jgi:hypothetical protein
MWWAAVLCSAALGLAAGCEEAHTSRPLQDASTDARAPLPDAQVASPDARAPQPDDAGDVVENAQCGLLDHELIGVFRGDQRILPGKPGTMESVASEATVTSIDRGDLKDWEFQPSEDGAYGRIRLTTPQATFTIVAHSVSSFGLTVGQAAKFSLDYRNDGLYPPPTRVSLQVGGELAFFYTAAGDVPKGFSHEPGATQCSGSVPCGDKVGYTWISKALRVRGPCGDSVELPAGGRGVVCGYEVLAGELRSDVKYMNCVGHGLARPEFTLWHKQPIDDSDAGR